MTNTEEEVIENEITGVYEITGINFKGENDWILSDCDETTFKVTIKDYDFMSKVMNGEVSFGSRDRVRCQILMKQSIMDDLIDTKYTVTKVFEYPRHRQSQLSISTSSSTSTVSISS